MVSQSVGVLHAHCTLKFSKSDPFDIIPEYVWMQKISVQVNWLSCRGALTLLVCLINRKYFSVEVYICQHWQCGQVFRASCSVINIHFRDWVALSYTIEMIDINTNKRGPRCLSNFIDLPIDIPDLLNWTYHILILQSLPSMQNVCSHVNLL